MLEHLWQPRAHVCWELLGNLLKLCRRLVALRDHVQGVVQPGLGVQHVLPPVNVPCATEAVLRPGQVSNGLQDGQAPVGLALLAPAAGGQALGQQQVGAAALEAVLLRQEGREDRARHQDGVGALTEMHLQMRRVEACR